MAGGGVPTNTGSHPRVRSRTARAHSSVYDDGRTRELKINLGYDQEAFMDDHGGSCAVLGDVSGSFGGQRVTLETAGGDDEAEGLAMPAMHYRAETTVRKNGHASRHRSR